MSFETTINIPLVILDDPSHSVAKNRFAALGRTDFGRKLVVIYTLRDRYLRGISARDMNKKERAFYEKQRKAKPVFKTEDEERDFWAAHSPLDYFDVAKAARGSFAKLKPSLKSISIRLPEDMLNELKILANKRDIPYQSLAKLYLSWGIRAERTPVKPS